MNTAPSGRRPLKTRDWPFFQHLAARLTQRGATPNGISFLSMVFAALAAVALVATSHCGGLLWRFCWIAAAAGVQLRLIANLLDGMLAVEGARGGPLGDLWNEAPDRVSDALIFISCGYAFQSNPLLGIYAALLSVFVAYIRALGASVGVGQVFLGPMAKPQRMAAVTAACLGLALAPTRVSLHLPIMRILLLIVIAGGLLTSVRRLAELSRRLRSEAN